MNWKTVCIVIALFAVLVLTGCIEEQRKPQATPTWGNGNPPATWTQTFGNDNIARVNFVQMQMLSNQAARIKRLEEFCRINNGKETNSPQSR